MALIKYYRHQTKFNEEEVTFNGVCHYCDIYTHTLKVIARKTMQIRKHSEFYKRLRMKCQKVLKYCDCKKPKSLWADTQSISFISKLCEISPFLPDNYKQTLT